MVLNLIHPSRKRDHLSQKASSNAPFPWSLGHMPVDKSCSVLCIPRAFLVSLSHNPYFSLMPWGTNGLYLTGLFPLLNCILLWMGVQRHPSLCLSRPLHTVGAQCLLNKWRKGEPSTELNTGYPTTVWVCFPKSR